MPERMHVLKCWPEFFEAMWQGDKQFEIRKNDRGYGVGDTLMLNEYEPDKCTYSGRQLIVGVTFAFAAEPWVPPGYIAMSTKVMARAKGAKEAAS